MQFIAGCQYLHCTGTCRGQTSLSFMTAPGVATLRQRQSTNRATICPVSIKYGSSHRLRVFSKHRRFPCRETPNFGRWHTSPRSMPPSTDYIDIPVYSAPRCEFISLKVLERVQSIPLAVLLCSFCVGRSLHGQLAGQKDPGYAETRELTVHKIAEKLSLGQSMVVGPSVLRISQSFIP